MTLMKKTLSMKYRHPPQKINACDSPLTILQFSRFTSLPLSLNGQGESVRAYLNHLEDEEVAVSEAHKQLRVAGRRVHPLQ